MQPASTDLSVRYILNELAPILRKFLPSKIIFQQFFSVIFRLASALKIIYTPTRVAIAAARQFVGRDPF